MPILPRSRRRRRGIDPPWCESCQQRPAVRRVMLGTRRGFMVCRECSPGA